MLTGDNPKVFACLLGGLQILIIVLLGLFTTYHDASEETTTGQNAGEFRMAWLYGFYQDVHVMIFIGFGFLMTFLKTYSWSAVGYNFMIAALCIQLSILILGFVHRLFANDFTHKISIDITDLIKGDFAAGAVLISFGGLLGRITPSQLIVMAVLELIFYAVNEEIGAVQFQAVDMGGSMFVHTFGAYFGLAASMVIGRVKSKEDNGRNGAVYHSDLFAMIGTLFLWMFWPSFNGALCPYESYAKERVVLNTVISLSASCLSAFACSRFVGGKFNMVHIQNATLAGGVAVGSSADLVIGPWGGALIGFLAGALSVMGYEYLSPWLERRLGLQDTCGVHNLHGMPGVMGGIAGCFSAWAAGESEYGTNISAVFPARDPLTDNRSAGGQAMYQILALLVTLAFAIVGGSFTGWVIKLMPREQKPFSDESHWLLESDDEEHHTSAVAMTKPAANPGGNTVV